MNNDILKNAIGSGVLFPIELTLTSDNTHTWGTVSGDISLIENNLRSLLFYQLGQKIREESFGTRLQECLEEQNTQLLTFLVKRFVITSIKLWEPRVVLLANDVMVTQVDEFLNLTLLPKVIVTQNVLNIDFNYNTKTGNLYVNN